MSKVLRRFLRGDQEELVQDDFLADKMLLEFPVFALNDDYIRALTNVVFMKLESVRNLINHKEREIQVLAEEKDKELREKSLSLLKSKIESRDISGERVRSRTPSCERRALPSKKDQIDSWIAKQQLRRH